MTWKGDLPPIVLLEKYQWQEQDIRELENSMTKHYVKIFYNYFQCAHIVPRGLSHVAAMYHVPDPLQVAVLDPRPDKFYDISVLNLL